MIRMKTAEGKQASGGYALGKIKLFKHKKSRFAEEFTSDREAEGDKLTRAVNALADENEKMYANALAIVGESEASIFEIHKMMLEDDDFSGEAARLIREEGRTAVNAVKKAADALAEKLRETESDYMRAREADIEAIADRLCAILVGDGDTLELTEPVIIASDDLTPAETVMLRRDMVLGFVTEYGSELSHTAILARMMGIPAVVSVGKIPDDWDGHTAFLDGGGSVYIDPDDEETEKYRKLAEKERTRLLELEKYRGVRLENKSGERVYISANAGEPVDVDEAAKNDAEGVGLFRSEFIFMSRTKPPSEDEQYEIYREAAKKLGGSELVVRTLDIGADKKIPYLTGDAHEANPALGIRAVRLCLRMPELIFTQLRALYRAAADGNISVMIPMIVLPSEVERVKEIARSVVASLDKEGVKYGRLKFGIMIETPSAAILADLLAPMVDFFSVGTNDLIQYTLAADRENPDVEYLTKPLPESVKRCIKMTCDAARKAGISVCVCGELGGETEQTEFLINAGVTKLSVAPGRVLDVRKKAAEALEKQK